MDTRSWRTTAAVSTNDARSESSEGVRHDLYEMYERTMEKKCSLNTHGAFSPYKIETKTLIPNKFISKPAIFHKSLLTRYAY